MPMIEIIALGLLTLFTIYYVYFITRLRIGLLSLRYAKTSNTGSYVTVIVAARNEEKFIGQCLQSLVQQTYPSKNYEVLVINDGSTDATASIVESFSKRFSNVHLRSLPNGTEHGASGKPIAISKGIDRAIGKIILTTDADCIAPPRWIEIMANHFEDNVVFVAGAVAEKAPINFFSKLTRLELLGLITTAAGLIGTGKPIICYGANLAYRKNAFHAIGGFGDTWNSNDDESLMNRIVHRKIGKVVFAPEPDSIITTLASNTISSFLRQRIRWANKRGRYEDKSIIFTLLSLYLFFLLFATVALLIPLDFQLLYPLLTAFGVKIIVDYFTLRSGAHLFSQRVQIFHFIIAELLHVPYIVIASAIGQLSSIRWKGRTIQS